MRAWRKFLLTLLIVFVLALLALVCYGIGEDVLGWIPLWLSKLILGAVFLTIGTIIVLIFAMGIIKIKEMTKEG